MPIVNTASSEASTLSKSNDSYTNDNSASIAANKATLEQGLTAPQLFDKLQTADVTTIDTPYGPLQVPTDTLKREGKDSILRDQATIVSQKSARDKDTSGNTIVSDVAKTSTDSGVKNADGKALGNSGSTAITSAATVSAQALSSPLTDGIYYYRRNTSQHPDLLYGLVDPQPVLTNNGQNYISYSIRNIYLANDSNACEADMFQVVSRQVSTGEIDVFISLNDNGYSQSKFTYPTLYLVNASAPIEYYIVINSSAKSYQAWLKNTKTNTWYYNSYVDNTISPYIQYYSGVVGLYYTSLDKWFKAYTCIKDTETRIGSTYYAPNEIFYSTAATDYSPYVQANGFVDNFSNTYSLYKSEYPAYNSTPGSICMTVEYILSGPGSSVTYPIVIGPEGANQTLTIVLWGTEDLSFEMYGKWGALPTTTSYDVKSTSGHSIKYIATRGVTPLYLMIVSTSGGGVIGGQVFTGTPEMAKIVTGNLSGPGSSETQNIPDIFYPCVFASAPPNSDYIMYLRHDTPPSTTAYDFKGYMTDYSTTTKFDGVPSTGMLYTMVNSSSGSGRYEVLELQF